MREKTSTVLHLGFGFLALGTLIGTLVAMSAQSLAQVVIAALFALFGGSLLVFLEKLSESNQVKAAVGVLAVSVGALAGVYSGVYVNEHQLLTPKALRLAAPKDVSEWRKYLRENVVSKANAVDVQYRNDMLKAKDAYEQLRALLPKD